MPFAERADRRRKQLPGESFGGGDAYSPRSQAFQRLDGLHRVDLIPGPDDGTLAPWAVAASLPFAPEIVLPTLHYFSEEVQLEQEESYGFKATFNPTYPVKDGNTNGWISPWNFGLNQGPIVLMIENYRSDLIWKTMRKNPYIVAGLKKAGFTGGWLGN